MKFKIFALIVLIGLVAYILSTNKPNIADTKIHYINIDCKIIQFGTESKLSDDKFKNPQLCKSVLFQLADDTTMYWEYNSCAERYSEGLAIDNAWFYNHRVGDVVHFDYLNKVRFFRINPR